MKPETIAETLLIALVIIPLLVYTYSMNTQPTEVVGTPYLPSQNPAQMYRESHPEEEQNHCSYPVGVGAGGGGSRDSSSN